MTPSPDHVDLIGRDGPLDTSPAWARVGDFIRLLAPGGLILEPFIRFFSGDRPTEAYRGLLAHAGQVEFRFAPVGARRPHLTFAVTLHHRGPTRAVVELPGHLASLDAAQRLAAALPDGGAPEVTLSLSRLHHMVCLSLRLVFAGHTDMLVRLHGKFGAVPTTTSFSVSCEDICADPGIIVLSRAKGGANMMMPDPAFFESWGYEAHKRDVLLSAPPWNERRDEAIWRGATTGSAFTAAAPLLNERIALAALCATRPDLFDAKITTVVQVATGEAEAVREELRRRGLLAGWATFASFARHKFAIHIDGNASAAGFLEKLSLGCCVLKVDSAFEQWIEPDVEPWRHFVPVSADLSDLIDKAEFLRRHPDLAERIARSGFGFAVDRSFEAEAGRFVAGICARQDWDDGQILLTAPAALEREVDRAQWHEAETMSDGRAYRWTAADRIVWPDCRLTPDVRPQRIAIPIVGEILPNFAARCRIEVGDRTYPVVIEDAHVVARVVIGPSEAGAGVALLTPPPLAPSAIRSSDDGRRLGLSVRLGS